MKKVISIEFGERVYLGAGFFSRFYDLKDTWVVPDEPASHKYYLAYLAEVPKVPYNQARQRDLLPRQWGYNPVGTSSIAKCDFSAINYRNEGVVDVWIDIYMKNITTALETAKNRSDSPIMACEEREIITRGFRQLLCNFEDSVFTSEWLRFYARSTAFDRLADIWVPKRVISSGIFKSINDFDKRFSPAFINPIAEPSTTVSVIDQKGYISLNKRYKKVREYTKMALNSFFDKGLLRADRMRGNGKGSQLIKRRWS